VHAPTEDKSDNIRVKNSFSEELGHVFDQFHTYHVQILLDFNAKAGREVVSNRQLGMRVTVLPHQKSNCQDYDVPTSQNSLHLN
jgi:hypothetical protein